MFSRPMMLHEEIKTKICIQKYALHLKTAKIGAFTVRSHLIRMSYRMSLEQQISKDSCMNAEKPVLEKGPLTVS